MIYRILVCDDEKLHRKILIEKIEEYFSGKEEKYKIIEASSGEDALKINKDINIHIAFLDIELQDMKGIDLSKRLKDVNDLMLIIFVTSYSYYMIEAFEQFAFNYVIKPVNGERINKILDKAIEEIMKRDKKDYKKFYNINKNNKAISILYEDIIYFEKIINNLVIVLEKENIEVRNTLKKVEKEIDMNYFIRCHRSIIINKKKIVQLIGDTLTLKGHDGVIPIGGKYKNNILKEISKMIREREE